MTRLSAQSIHALCTGPTPMIHPYSPDKVVSNGKSYGLSAASYDVRIAHDLTLGVNPAHIIAQHAMATDPLHDLADLVAQGRHGEFMVRLVEGRAHLAQALAANPPHFALAHTMEDFHFPTDISGQVADKSTYARLFVSAFNTFFDPGFIGNATLELVNLSDQPVTYKAGDPVCQFLFDRLDAPTDRPYSGKYQHQTKAAHPARHEDDVGAP